MTAPYLNTEPNPQTAAEADAAFHLRVAYRAMTEAKKPLTSAAILLDGRDVPGSAAIEDDYADLLSRVRQMLKACGGRIPA